MNDKLNLNWNGTECQRVGGGQDKAGRVCREGVFFCDGQKRAGECGKFHSGVDGMVGGGGRIMREDNGPCHLSMKNVVLFLTNINQSRGKII